MQPLDDRGASFDGVVVGRQLQEQRDIGPGTAAQFEHTAETPSSSLA